MIKDLRDWKKESERKNKNKHQWGWFQHPNAGNVEYNIDFFNHVTGADGGDTSVLAGSVGDGGMGESLDMNDKVELYYDDIEVSGYYGPTDWETGYPKKEYNETIDWEYKVDRDDIFVDLEEFIEEESPELSDEELEKIVSENFDELVDKYYQQLLDKYRKRAEEDANENYEYDEYDHYLDAMGESVNIREALNKIDCNTCGKYDLLNMYDCSDMSLEKKAKLAEMLKENVSADKLYEYMDEESPWQIGLELAADNGYEYKVISVLDEREVDGYELSIVGAIGNELSNADEEVYFVLLDSDIEWGPVDTAEEALEWASDVQDGYYTQEDNFDYDDDYDDEYTGIEERLTPSGREKLVSDKTMYRAVEAAKTVDPNAKGDYDDDFIYGDDGHGGSTWEILLNGDGKAYSTWGRNAVLTSKVEKAVNDAADAYWADFDKRGEEVKKACRRGNAMNEGALKEIDLEVQEAGGVDAYIEQLESQLRNISREMRFLRGQARREMKAGGAYDSVDEINDALTATMKEYNEVRKKYDYISSQQTGGVN